MTAGTDRQGMTWTARFAWALLLLLAGAGLATWALSQWDSGARFFGVAPNPPLQIVRQLAPPPPTAARASEPISPADAARISAIEGRLAAIESQAQAAAGSAGRADAMLIAFAARRAIDRGVALGYLEPLLIQRFSRQNQAAVATIVTASRDPLTLDKLISDFRALGPALRGAGPEESWWDGFRRELGSIVTFRRSGSPSPRPQARYERALASLEAGKVDAALAETMRLPGAAHAAEWTAQARRYIASHRALDEIESAALLGNPAPPVTPQFALPTTDGGLASGD